MLAQDGRVVHGSSCARADGGRRNLPGECFVRTARCESEVTRSELADVDQIGECQM